jgi:hypothetical protein
MHRPCSCRRQSGNDALRLSGSDQIVTNSEELILWEVECLKGDGLTSSSCMKWGKLTDGRFPSCRISGRWLATICPSRHACDAFDGRAESFRQRGEFFCSLLSSLLQCNDSPTYESFARKLRAVPERAAAGGCREKPGNLPPTRHFRIYRRVLGLVASIAFADGMTAG